MPNVNIYHIVTSVIQRSLFSTLSHHDTESHYLLLCHTIIKIYTIYYIYTNLYYIYTIFILYLYYIYTIYHTIMEAHTMCHNVKLRLCHVVTLEPRPSQSHITPQSVTFHLTKSRAKSVFSFRQNLI